MAVKHKQFWEIIFRIPACMVTTAVEELMRARPMATIVDPEARKISFVASATG